MEPMKIRRKTIRALALWGSLSGWAATGCSHGLGDPNADIPKGAMPAEPGTYLHEVAFREASKAERDDFVIYQYEWVMDAPQLGPFGRKHLATIWKRLESDAPFGILIEASDDPKLDEQRFLAATDLLGKLGLPDPASHVRIGLPGAEALVGDVAERTYFRYIFSGGGIGGAGGGGFGAGLGGLGGFGGGGIGFGGGGIGNFGGTGGFGAGALGSFGGGGFGGGYGGFR
jgi:hypothetical protein